MDLRVLSFFSKQKTEYEIKECAWSSDVCSSDLVGTHRSPRRAEPGVPTRRPPLEKSDPCWAAAAKTRAPGPDRRAARSPSTVRYSPPPRAAQRQETEHEHPPERGPPQTGSECDRPRSSRDDLGAPATDHGVDRLARGVCQAARERLTCARGQTAECRGIGSERDARERLPRLVRQGWLHSQPVQHVEARGIGAAQEARVHRRS